MADPADADSAPGADPDLARLQRNVNLLTTLVLFLVFVELAKILEDVFSWNPLVVIGIGVFLTTFAWVLAYLTS